MYDAETHSQFITLRAKGCTLSQIAGQLDISFKTARNWNQEHWEEIKDMQDHLRDSFVERFLPGIGEELDSLTAELERINAELEKRDYSKEATRGPDQPPKHDPGPSRQGPRQPPSAPRPSYSKS